MRRSSSAQQIASGIPRRSSSIDGNSWNNVAGSQSGSSSQQSQFQRQSMGRASSIGVGRPSILGAKGASDVKPLNANEIAQSLVTMLTEELDYKQPLTTKILLLPSTATFYQLFEYLLKFMGIPDVWNTSIIAAQLQNQANQNGNNAPAPSQPLNNAVAQNKARIETIIYYLGLFRYPNIPKANVLQTMTTPKNWLWMLQILQFLANNCKFVMIYDATKLLNTFNASTDCEVLHDYLKKSYLQTLYDPTYLKSERHVKLKQESLTKFAQQLRAGYDLEHLQLEMESVKKDYDFLKSTENDLENILEEEKELARELAEEERLLALEAAEFDEEYKAAKAKKKELSAFKEKIKKDEEILKVKDAEYDRQLASGKQLDKLPAKHSQKLQELERLQNQFVDMEKEIETLQGKVLLQSQDAKDTISQANSIVNKIKLGSTIALEEFPHIEMTDFHRKTDLIKPYKEGLLKLREKHNAELCKLPEVLAQLREEKKSYEAKKEAFKAKNESLEKEGAKLEEVKVEILKSSREVIEGIKVRVSQSRNAAIEAEEELKSTNAVLVNVKTDFDRLLSDQRKIEAELDMEVKTWKERSENTEKTACKTLQDRQNSIVANQKKESQSLMELTNKVHQYMAIVKQKRQEFANSISK